MQSLLYTLLIALTNSIDSLGAWIAFSLKGIRVSPRINLWVSFIIFAVSAVFTLAGSALGAALGSRLCDWLSMAVFTGMGLWFLLEPVLRRIRVKRQGSLIGIMEHPEEADSNRSKDIDWKEAALLGAALSINNAGGSFSAGMIGLSPWLIGLFSAAISFGALWLGRWVSSFFMRFRLGEAASVVSGLIMIVIGIKQVL